MSCHSVSSKFLIEMFHKNVWSKCFIKMSHSVLYVLSSINVHFLYSLYFLYFLYFLCFLPSSIVHHPSIYTFCTFFHHISSINVYFLLNGQKYFFIRSKAFKNQQNGQKLSKWSKAFKNGKKR